MEGAKWRLLLNHFQLGCTFFSLIFNSFLIFLITKKSPKVMGTYKHLLICISSLEILYSITDIVVSPIIHSSHTVVLVITVVKDSFLSPHIKLILATVYCGFFGCSLAFFAVLFVYRYYAISGDPKIKTFNSWKIIFWLSGVLVCGVLWSILGYYTCGPKKEIDDVISEDIQNKLSLNITDITYLAPHFYLKDKSDKDVIQTTINWVSIGGMVGFCSIASVTCGVIVYYGRRWYAMTRNSIQTTTSSEKYKSIQRQLFSALVLQTTIPVFLLHVPFSILFLCAALDVHLGQLSGLNTLTIALFPVLDPLPTAFIVENYRKALLGYLVCFGGKKSVAPSVIP